MALLKKLKDKTGTIHDLGDSRIDALETELSGAAHNVPYSPAVLAKTNAIETSISNHVGNTANPHKVTKAQIGLANVENKSSTQIRSELTKENVTNALGYTPIDESRIGAANGVASLDASGRIPASQIPGGFDNIEEYDNLAAFPTTGEEGKIYVAKDTNLTYRWTGSQYVEISPSLALGETATTAYRGDRGKIAYDHSQVSGNSTIHHTHANKELLDSYTQTEADLANAVSKVHEHGNKSVLDGITSDKVNSWDGKEDAFNVLPTTKGGTGTNAASKSALTSSLINSLSTESSTPVDADYYVSQHQNGGTSNTSFVRRPVSSLWTYIKGKIESVLGLTKSNYAGKAATAGTADKAVADKSGNDIETTYATKSELSTHTSDTTVHITAAERTAWNAKQSALTFDTTPKAGSTNPVTSGGIKTALDLKANASDLTAHTGNTTVHITAAERTAWNAKASTSVATTSANGLMSKTDKAKLDGISSGANKSDVSYASKKLTKTINGTTTDVVAASTIISDTNTFGNFAAVTDVTVSNIKFHTYWQVAPTSSNQVYGFAVHPTNGKLYRVYNNKGSYSVYGYDTDTNTTYSFDGTYNSSTNKAATVSSITSRIATAKTELTAAIDSEASARESADTTLQSNIDTVDAKGIVINEIAGENVICFE